jgi:hypothetical protein
VPILCASCSRPIHEDVPRTRPVTARRAWRFGWGVAWRYAILGGLFLFAQSRPQKPWLVMLGVLVVGLLLGLWRRRSGLARLWRTVVVAGGAVYVAPLFAIYPDVLVGSIGALTVGPLLATWRREYRLTSEGDTGDRVTARRGAAGDEGRTRDPYLGKVAFPFCMGNISRLEHASDLYLSTLSRYVEALAGHLELTAVCVSGPDVCGPVRREPLLPAHVRKT